MPKAFAPILYPKMLPPIDAVISPASLASGRGSGLLVANPKGSGINCA